MFKEMILSAQIMCMTEAMYYEARGEGVQGMKEVAAVVHNRVFDSQSRYDYCEIIGRPNQFSYLEGREPGTLPIRNEKIETTARIIARDVVGTPHLIMGGIKYFHRYDMTPNWNFSLLEFVRRTGDHVFYRDR